MTGTCINTIKVIGVSSLGLLTASLSYQSVEVIPKLIDELTTKVSNSNWCTIKYGKLINKLLVGLSTSCFILSYKYSPINEKHPYLIYSILGGLASLGYTYFSSCKEEKKLSKFNVPKPSPKTKVINEANEDNEDDLGKSYIHVSDEDSTSTSSTPSQSVAASPKPEADDIEDEINLTLFKKEMKMSYVNLKSIYLTGAGCFGFTFLISTIGIIGDFMMT